MAFSFLKWSFIPFA